MDSLGLCDFPPPPHLHTVGDSENLLHKTQIKIFSRNSQIHSEPGELLLAERNLVILEVLAPPPGQVHSWWLTDDWLIQGTDGRTPCLSSREKAATLWCDSYSREGSANHGPLAKSDCFCKQSSIGTKQGSFILLPTVTNVLPRQSWEAERWWNLLTLVLELYSQLQTPPDTPALAWFSPLLSCCSSALTGCTQFSVSGSASWQGRLTHVLASSFSCYFLCVSIGSKRSVPDPCADIAKQSTPSQLVFWISDALLRKGKCSSFLQTQLFFIQLLWWRDIHCPEWSLLP